jgi:hypothetical protein
MVLPAGVSRTGPRGPSDLNPRQRLERPLSLTTRLRERPGSVRDPLLEPFCESGRPPWRERSAYEVAPDVRVVTPPVKARSGHILLDPKRSYKDLVRVYPEIHRRVVEMNRPFVKETDPLLPEVLLDENLRDLKGNRKPTGYNRQDAFGLRLIFPLSDERRAEFYFTKPARCQEVVQITEQVSVLLRRRGIKHTVEYDRLPLGPPRGPPGLPPIGAATPFGST